jgi:LPS-assembly protein
MKRYLPLLGILFGWVFVSSSLEAASRSPWNIKSRDANGVVEFDVETGRVTGRNGIIINYTKKSGEIAELTANQVTVNQQTGQVEAKGHVFMRSSGQVWLGDELKYNFKTSDIETGSFRTGYAPVYVSGLGLSATVSNNTYYASNSIITTDDIAKPFYRIEAEEVRMVPGIEIVAKKATVYVGNVPVFYLPKYRRSLERHPNFWVTNPGYRSLWGPYLLTEYNWIASESLSGAMHFDYRQRRGFGIGPEIKLNLGRYGEFNFDGYYTRDDAPHLNAPGFTENNRHRLQFTYEANIRTNFSVKAVFREQGDPFILRDFFEWEYQRNTQPSSFLEVEYLWDNWGLNALAMPRVNDFFERIERLPDVQLTGLRQQLGNTPLYYESQSSAGYLKHEFANNVTAPFAATRADSFHQVLLPKTYFGWLNFTPRIGGRYTYYSESEGGFAGTEANRWIFNTGAEASIKFTRTWADRDLPIFKSKGMRHIVEPTINYAFVPSPNKRPFELPQFDSTVPSLRLLPLDFPDFNAIDSVDSENTLRLGIRNNVQTKRNGEIDTLLNWNLFTDWHLRTRPDQDTFADLFSDIDFKPREWLTLTSETRYDIDAGVFSIADHRMILTPDDQWSLSLGHRYIRTSPLLGAGHNLILASYYYRLNENWGFNVRETFEARDGVLEEQAYSIYRDFRSWVGSLTFRLRDSRVSVDDFTVGFTFSTKALPRLPLGTDLDTPSYLISNR